jgi:hypothetical protein
MLRARAISVQVKDNDELTSIKFQLLTFIEDLTVSSPPTAAQAARGCPPRVLWLC